ncbi:helix-turn-helix domain-containing protein [Adlercreutzia caecimuris]|jgi:DNA-binding CsgD family transcriptional regulator|uniref:helix-turn-helix domain-containing protein n=1 Tax=Adlercreutzia caecimuris TaxID=671266 RepID=UPI0013737459|nr:helix-turn-helix domain-containing protein [Adlercreutzia caecimuris]
MVNNVLQTARATLAMPLVWAMALLFAAMETSSAFPVGALQALSHASAPTFAALGEPELLSVIAYGLLLAAARPIGSAVSRPWLFAVAPAANVLGMLLCAGASDSAYGIASAWIGIACVQGASALLTVMVLELLCSCSSLWVLRAVVGSALVNAPLAAIGDGAPLEGAIAFLITGSAALGLSYRAWRCGMWAPCADPVFKRAGSFPPPLAVGLAVVSAGFGFLQQLLYQQDVGVVVGVITGTKFAAVLLFVVVAGLLGSAIVAMLAKTIITFATAAFLVFLAQGGYSPLSSALMSTGYSLFEMTTYLVLAELALSLRVRSLSLLSAFYLIETAGYLAGCSLETASGSGGLDERMVAVVLALALLVCAVWVFTEKHMNDLLWGRGDEPAGDAIARESEGGSDAGALRAAAGGLGAQGATHPETPGDPKAVRGEGASGPYGQGVALVAERFRLSPRETEVLELFAAGRSATFIAELQFVTTNTVRSHIKHIYGKCDVHSRQELITLIERAAER